MGRLVKRALLLLALVACTKKETPPPPAPVVDAGPQVAVVPDAHDVVEKSCLSCHTDQMLKQQRLTEPQWSKVVAKMAGWGANLEASDTPALIAYLAANYGPDAGAYAVDFAAVDELDPTPDGAFANGDAERGKPLYVDKCSACHGGDGKGHIGVNLVDRPLLYRAETLANVARKGRGKMPPQKVSDAELADIIAYVRTLH